MQRLKNELDEYKQFESDIRDCFNIGNHENLSQRLTNIS